MIWGERQELSSMAPPWAAASTFVAALNSSPTPSTSDAAEEQVHPLSSGRLSLVCMLANTPRYGAG
jgi:hypothetical protein